MYQIINFQSPVFSFFFLITRTAFLPGIRYEKYDRPVSEFSEYFRYFFCLCPYRLDPIIVVSLSWRQTT